MLAEADNAITSDNGFLSGGLFEKPDQRLAVFASGFIRQSCYEGRDRCIGGYGFNGHVSRFAEFQKSMNTPERIFNWRMNSSCASFLPRRTNTGYVEYFTRMKTSQSRGMMTGERGSRKATRNPWLCLVSLKKAQPSQRTMPTSAPAMVAMFSFIVLVQFPLLSGCQFTVSGQFPRNG